MVMVRRCVANGGVVGMAFVVLMGAGAGLTFGASQFVIMDDGALQEESPSVAYNLNNGTYLVVWHNDRAGNDDIRGQRVDGAGNLLGSPFYISSGAGADRTNPDVAYDDRNDQFLVVWEHYDTSWGWGIHCRRVSGSGALIDGSDIEVRSSTTLSTSARPSVSYAFTADSFMVVWEETWHPLPITYTIVGQVVDEYGMLSGSQITINSASNGDIRSRPDIAYNRGRNEYLAVWQQLDSAGGITDVVAQRMTAAGVLLGAAWHVAYYTVSSKNPAVSALPTVGMDGQYLVVWALEYSGNDWDIMGHLIDGDGSQASVALGIAASNAIEARPAVAGNEAEGSYAVTWSRLASGVADVIQGAPVAYDGTIGTGRTLGGDSGDSSAVAAQSNGGDFLAVFEDTPSGNSTTGVYGSLFFSLFANGFESGDTSAWSSKVP